MELWSPSTIYNDQLIHGRFGPVGLWFKRVQDELHFAYQRHEPDSLDAQCYKISQRLQAVDTAEEKLEWSRWITGNKLDTIQILPFMPDRPIVVKTEMPIKIPENQSADFFVSIPIWLIIMAANPEKLEICELPSIILPSMWFGDTTAGELCYAIRSRARRNISSDQARPYRAICPIRVTNATQTQLAFQRVCIRVEHLRIYQGRNQLCTNMVDMTYCNQDGTTEINYIQAAPVFEEIETMLSDARVPFKQSLLKRSFNFCWLF